MHVYALGMSLYRGAMRPSTRPAALCGVIGPEAVWTQSSELVCPPRAARKAHSRNGAQVLFP